MELLSVFGWWEAGNGLTVRSTWDMSTLYLVRHGQASFMSADYDRLSPLGQRQAAALGTFWGERGQKLHTIYVGPKRRHQQSFTAFARAYEAHGLRLPTPQPYPFFDEHEGFQVARALLPQLAADDPWIASLYNDGEMTRNGYLELFRHLMRRWANGEINSDKHENWQPFKARIKTGIEQIQSDSSAKSTIAVFTSGGAMAMATGLALDLSEDRIVELGWIVRNGAIAEFAFTPDRFSLVGFNCVPHLDSAEMITYV